VLGRFYQCYEFYSRIIVHKLYSRIIFHKFYACIIIHLLYQGFFRQQLYHQDVFYHRRNTGHCHR
jgi:hypothetical protein